MDFSDFLISSGFAELFYLHETLIHVAAQEL